MKQHINFKKFVQAWCVSIIVGIVVTITAVDSIYHYYDFRLRSDEMRADHIANQKQIVKQEVMRVVDLITYEREQREVLVRNKIKSRVYEAYSVAQHIYSQNKTTKSKAEAQQMILDALRPVRFAGGSGYFFATRLDGVEILFADKPEMEGLNLLDMQDTRGQYVVRSMIETVKQSNEGFFEYHWTKPNTTGNDFKKISFCKRFEPYDWFIGAGLYVDDIEEQIKKNLLSTISRIRFGKEGYVFIYTYDACPLVRAGKVYPGTKKIWEYRTGADIERMKAVFKRGQKAALTPGGDFYYYSTEKLSTPDEVIKAKVSFAYSIPELQWMIGAGVYLDDVEKDNALMQAALNKEIKVKFLYVLLIALVIVTFFLILFRSVTRRLANDIDLFVSFFKQAAVSDELIDRSMVRFEEFGQIAEKANKMLIDRNQAEEKRLQALQETHSIMETVPDIIFMLDSEGKFINWNKSLEDKTGYTKADLKAKVVLELFPDDDRESTTKAITETYEKGSATIELRLLTKEGDLILHFFSATVKKNDSGNVIGLVGIAKDITEQRKLEAQLQQAQKMEAIGVLAGGVAHDFNNILTVIMGNADIALEDVGTDGSLRNEIEVIKTAGEMGAALTRQLLAFSRKQIIQPMILDLNKLLAGIEKMLGRLISEDVEILKITGPALWQVEIDPGQMEQIIMNLAINARDAMPRGGKLTIETDNMDIDKNYCYNHGIEEQAGSYVMLAVSDTGKGMDKKTQERIFEPFYTTKERGKGTGLGLSTVYGIVKQNNGFVWVYSEPGKGSTFKVYLPKAERNVTSEEKEQSPVTERGGSESILIVEDDDALRKLTGSILKRNGYKVLEAENGEDALRISREHEGSIELMLTDVIMPKMGGKETAEQLQPLRPQMKILYMSGYTDNAIVHHGVLVAELNFIQKPFSPKDLTCKVREVLDKKQD